MFFHTMPFLPWNTGLRIGEASNPGPGRDTPLRCAVINPTAICGKLPELLSLNSDLIFAAETSAVSRVQTMLSSGLRPHGFKAHFSAPVCPLLSDADPATALRGMAGGVAILSRVPSRPSVEAFTPELLATTRLTECFVRLGAMEVRAICVYGLPSSHANASELNNFLLQACHERVRMGPSSDCWGLEL